MVYSYLREDLPENIKVIVNGGGIDCARLYRKNGKEIFAEDFFEDTLSERFTGIGPLEQYLRKCFGSGSDMINIDTPDSRGVAYKKNNSSSISKLKIDDDGRVRQSYEFCYNLL